MIMVNVPTKMTGLTANVMTISLATAAAVRNPIGYFRSHAALSEMDKEKNNCTNLLLSIFKLVTNDNVKTNIKIVYILY